jgi:hypothetical protein
MTKARAVLPARVVAELEPFFTTFKQNWLHRLHENWALLYQGTLVVP